MRHAFNAMIAFHGSSDCMVTVMTITESLSTFLIGGMHGSDMQRDELANQELGRSYFDEVSMGSHSQEDGRLVYRSVQRL